MEVTLLYHTPDPERAVATAARLCYAPVGGKELMEGLTDERIHKVLGTIDELPVISLPLSTRAIRSASKG